MRLAAAATVSFAVDSEVCRELHAPRIAAAHKINTFH
jgi:hypothetical protein